jgi:hypothetical protein
MQQDLLINFDYVFDSDWGKMVYKILKDDSIKILMWESKEKYELCAKQMKETYKKIDDYAAYHEHYHLSFDELQLLFQNTFSTLIEYNRKHYTTFE